MMEHSQVHVPKLRIRNIDEQKLTNSLKLGVHRLTKNLVLKG